MEDTKTTLNLKSVLNIDPPKDFKVIYMNDDQTTFDFVSGSLVKIFDYDEEPAQAKTVEINSNGSGVVAVMPFEIAEQKGVAVKDLAVGGSSVEEVASATTVPSGEASATVDAAKEQPLTDEQLAKNMRADADRMFKEAERLRKEAEDLSPSKKAKSSAKA